MINTLNYTTFRSVADAIGGAISQTSTRVDAASTQKLQPVKWHKVAGTPTQLQPLGSDILFTFTEDVVGGRFVDVTPTGIYVGTGVAADTHNRVRFGVVVAIGSMVRDVRVGDTIGIEPLKWTESIVHHSTRLWKTTEGYVIGILE